MNLSVLPNKIKKLYRSLADIINSISYQLKDYKKIIDISKINTTHTYNFIKVSNYKKSINDSNKIINIIENDKREKLTFKSHFSKKNNDILSKKDYEKMNLGTKIHELFEVIDFKNPDFSMIDSLFYKNLVKNFLNNDLLANVENAEIYKEFEFIYYEKDIEYRGIIDLMLEYDNHIDIIDYKLKNVYDDAYKKQLDGYKKYIKTRKNKRINVYLYSILDNKFYILD